MKHIAPIIAFTMITSVSSAADIAVPDTAPVQTEASPLDWSGFYIGAHGGWGRGKVEGSGNESPIPTTGVPLARGISVGGPSGDTQDADLEGWFGGGQVGYMWQSSNNWVGGLEADISFGSVKDDFEDVIAYSDDYSSSSFGVRGSTKIDMIGTVRGKVGYAYDRFLPFVTGGLAWANVKSQLTNVNTYNYFEDDVSYDYSRSTSSSATHFGWTIGAGVEYALTDHWRTKIEYRYHDFRKSFSDAYKQDIKPTLNTVQVGLSYKF